MQIADTFAEHFSLVMTTRSTRKSVPRVDNEVSTSLPITSCALCRSVGWPTRCSRSPARIIVPGDGTISVSSRFRREQMILSLFRIGTSG
ncbi:hypothetical protein MYA98_15815 [Salmonella sp. WGH-01]|nr:hypothetical protein MYA98_15815 [Salmonella sp. WGH-01]